MHNNWLLSEMAILPLQTETEWQNRVRSTTSVCILDRPRQPKLSVFYTGRAEDPGGSKSLNEALEDLGGMSQHARCLTKKTGMCGKLG